MAAVEDFTEGMSGTSRALTSYPACQPSPPSSIGFCLLFTSTLLVPFSGLLTAESLNILILLLFIASGKSK